MIYIRICGFPIKFTAVCPCYWLRYYMLVGPDHTWLAPGEYIRSMYGNEIPKKLRFAVPLHCVPEAP